MLKRSKHWATCELHDHMIERAQLPHAYGKNDCALFAADGIRAMTGVDIAEDFRGYAGPMGAQRAIAKITGGSTVEDAAVYCAKKYELPELEHPLTAKRGDLVLLEQDGDKILGLVHLSGTCAVAPGDAGLRRIPLSAIKRAWRIGNV